eukprot:1158959-Pelagomonas_calceolata.AAC.5
MDASLLRCDPMPTVAGPPNYKILQDMGPSTGAEDEGADAGELQGGSSGSRVGEAEASGRSAGQTRAALEEEESGGEGALTPAPGSISIMESCLVDWASKSRVRLKVTVRTTHDPGNGEVEMEVGAHAWRTEACSWCCLCVDAVDIAGQCEHKH